MLNNNVLQIISIICSLIVMGALLIDMFKNFK